jgi:heterodisulfide reductase subunit A-like polyferredoxin
VAVVDEELCAGCGDCLARCQFGALRLDADNVCLVDPGRCVGCGLCAMVCPADALHLARRTAEEIVPPPETFGDWRARRARSRGLEVT